MEGPVVLDTSVILKWFCQEEALAGQALALRDAYLDGQIGVVVPSLLAYELANVLRYKGDLTTDQVQEAVQSLFGMRLEWVLPSSATMRRAVGIARAYEATVHDAAFAALAEWLEATFVTADERLAHRLEPLPFVRFLGSVNAESLWRINFLSSNPQDPRDPRPCRPLADGRKEPSTCQPMSRSIRSRSR